MGGDVALIKIVLSRVRTDVLLLSCPCGNDQRKGGKGVQCEDCIAKEGSGDEAQERLEVVKAAAVGGGGGEGCKVVGREAAHDVLNGGDNHLGRAEGCNVVHDDRDSGRAYPDEAAHFVGGAEEGAAKIVGVVEDGDFLFFVCRAEKTVGLVKPCHFYFKACLKIHRAGETSDILIAGLVHRGDQVKKSFPGGMGGHGIAFFISTKSYGGWADEGRMMQMPLVSKFLCMVHSARIWLVIHVNNRRFSTNFLVEPELSSRT